MCSLSPWKTGRPLISRRAIVTPVSTTGRPKARIGVITATAVVAFCVPSTESAGESETDKERARISKENRRWIEVVTQKARQCAAQGQRDYNRQTAIVAE